MFVRMLQGRYAGQVVEVKFTVGKDLLALGRAEDPEREEGIIKPGNAENTSASAKTRKRKQRR